MTNAHKLTSFPKTQMTWFYGFFKVRIFPLVRFKITFSFLCWSGH